MIGNSNQSHLRRIWRVVPMELAKPTNNGRTRNLSSHPMAAAPCETNLATGSGSSAVGNGSKAIPPLSFFPNSLRADTDTTLAGRAPAGVCQCGGLHSGRL